MGSPVSVVVAKIVMQTRKKPWKVTNEQYHSGYATSTILLPLYTKTKSTIFTNISTDKTPTFSLPRRSRTMVRLVFLTAWSPVTTTDYRRRFAGNPPTLTVSSTNYLTTAYFTKGYNNTDHNETYATCCGSHDSRRIFNNYSPKAK